MKNSLLDIKETIVTCNMCGYSFIFKMAVEEYTIDKVMKKGREILKEHYKNKHKNNE